MREWIKLLEASADLGKGGLFIRLPFLQELRQGDSGYHSAFGEFAIPDLMGGDLYLGRTIMEKFLVFRIGIQVLHWLGSFFHFSRSV